MFFFAIEILLIYFYGHRFRGHQKPHLFIVHIYYNLEFRRALPSSVVTGFSVVTSSVVISIGCLLFNFSDILNRLYTLHYTLYM